MQNKALLGIASLVVVALLGISLVVAFPFGRGAAMDELTEEKKAGMQEFREAVQQAIEDGDYAAWKALMESQLTEEHFNKLVEMHEKRAELEEKNSELMEAMKEARESGDFEGMKELRQEMGFKGFKGEGKHRPFGKDCFMHRSAPGQAE